MCGPPATNGGYWAPINSLRNLRIFLAVGWPADDICLDDTEVLQWHSKILSFDFESERDESNPAAIMIPFQAFHSLLDDPTIDVTGLSFSSTKRGNLYRTHRLMAPVGVSLEQFGAKP